MQMFIFLVLLALTTTLDAAIVQEAGGIEGDKLQKGFEATALKDVGQKVESLGKLLQGEASLSTLEGRQSTLDAIKALKTFAEKEPEEGTEEYFFLLIVKAILVGVLAGGASAGIKFGVESIQKGK